MADELNIPTHRWYQKRNHIALAKEDFSRQFIYDSGIQKIDAWINSQPWGDPYIVNSLEPPLVLDFIEDYYRTGGSASTFDDALNFSRASAATYTDADGVLQTAAAGVPRVGNHVYNGSDWVNEGFLLESEARTNLYESSNDLSTAALFNADDIVTTQDETGPDGLTSAWTITDDGVSGVVGSSRFCVAQATSDAGDYTASFYLKAGANTWAYLQNSNFDIGNGETYFNLSAGTIGTVNTGVTANIKDVGSGFFRCSITITETTGGISRRVFVGMADGDGNSGVTQDGTNSIIAYGAQLEEGSTPSSYIPTAGSTVTRAAETLDVAAADMPWPEPVEVTGTELVTNGTFDTDTDWEKGTGWTISGGTANSDGTASGSTSRFSQTGVFTAGKQAIIKFDITSRTSGSVRVSLHSVFSADLSAVGSYELTINPTTDFLRFECTSFVGSIDNVSVKEVSQAVSIQMDGAMTYADEDEVTGVSFYDWAVDANNNLASIIRTTNTPINWRATQAESGVFDSVLQSPADYQPGVNVPFSIASRHGSTFINGAVDGTALTENDTPTALPDLSATDFDIGPTFMGNIGKLRVWSEDLTDEGIEEASA